MFYKRNVPQNFTKFIGIHLCQGFFLIKLQFSACIFTKETLAQVFFFKKETLARVFPCEFCKIFKNAFFTEHLWTTASAFLQCEFDLYRSNHFMN